MLTVAEILAKENDDLLNRRNVRIHIQDAIVEIMRNDEKYDVIFNTLSGPKFYAANKLYTQEFLQAVKKKLEPGGIYTGWSSTRDDRIIPHLATVHSVFSQCHYYFFGLDFVIYICGEDLVRRNQLSDNSFVQKVSRLEYKTFAQDINHFMNLKVSLNTIDHPILSFIESSSSYKNNKIRKILENWQRQVHH